MSIPTWERKGLCTFKSEGGRKCKAYPWAKDAESGLCVSHNPRSPRYIGIEFAKRKVTRTTTRPPIKKTPSAEEVWPYGSTDPISALVARNLPTNLPDYIRAEMGQTLALWILEGRIADPMDGLKEARQEANAHELRRSVPLDSRVTQTSALCDYIVDEGGGYGRVIPWAKNKAIAYDLSFNWKGATG